jgi:hypothetical protein
MLDNDCDGLIDCMDPDCAGIKPCPKIRNDPTYVRFGASGQLDIFQSHGKVETPLVDLTQTEVGWLLTNSTDTLYRGRLPVGALVPASNGKIFRFRDPDARLLGTSSGISAVKIRQLRDGSGYAYSVRAYGDIPGAKDPAMAVQFYVGPQVFVTSAIWTQTSYGWQLPKDH